MTVRVIEMLRYRWRRMSINWQLSKIEADIERLSRMRDEIEDGADKLAEELSRLREKEGI